MLDLALIEECAPNVHPATMASLVKSESSFNPFAIGVVGMDLIDQPTNKKEAIAISRNLMKQGYNISLGLAQINIHNFENLNLDIESAFDPCRNLSASESVLTDCYTRAQKEFSNSQAALQAALSCYYSNNFTRGFEPDDSNNNSYVERFSINREEIASEFYDSISDDHQIPDLLALSFGKEVETVKRKKVDEINALEELDPHEGTNKWDVFNELNS